MSLLVKDCSKLGGSFGGAFCRSHEPPSGAGCPGASGTSPPLLQPCPRAGAATRAMWSRFDVCSFSMG